MKYRKLRIAWSVGWGVGAALLVAIWVRSYWRWDTAYFPLGERNTIVANSFIGRMDLFYGIERHDRLGFETTATAHVAPSDLVRRAWHYSSDDNGHYVTFPHWCLVLVALTGTVAPWLPLNRFSLRTLLIATTLIAVVLGINVFVSRGG